MGVIEVHIEHLELDGVDPGDGAAVAAALRETLAGHLAARGLPDAWAAGAELGAVDAGEVVFDGPAALGRQVAGRLVR